MSQPKFLRPFWRYYGGKWRAAPKYSSPNYETIIEPFAGAAGYALRYFDRNIILVDKYPVIAGIWRYLINVKSTEILKIPLVDHVDDLPSWVPQEARWLVGFRMNNATASPCRQLSIGSIRKIELGSKGEGWSEPFRQRVASQVQHIRHWKIIEGDYTLSPDIEATWFIDPPYNNRAGSYYVHSNIDYLSLAGWCHSRKGQTIVCENKGAKWLDFKPFSTIQGAFGRLSPEVVWTSHSKN